MFFSFLQGKMCSTDRHRARNLSSSVSLQIEHVFLLQQYHARCCLPVQLKHNFFLSFSKTVDLFIIGGIMVRISTINIFFSMMSNFFLNFIVRYRVAFSPFFDSDNKLWDPSFLLAVIIFYCIQPYTR